MMLALVQQLKMLLTLILAYAVSFVYDHFNVLKKMLDGYRQTAEKKERKKQF